MENRERRSRLMKFIKALAFDFGHTLVNEELRNGQIQLMPGVKEVLPQLRLPMAVWANTRTAGEEEICRLLQAVQLYPYFSCVVTSMDAGARKPSPKFFDFAL